MKILKLAGSIFALLFGPFLFVYGGYDDSPGAQGLGLLLFIVGVFSTVKIIKKKSPVPTP